MASMSKDTQQGRFTKTNWLLIVIYAVLAVFALLTAKRYANPAPPSRLVISTGDDEGDYQTYAEQYKSIIQQSGVELVIRKSAGPSQNLGLLNDPKSGVDVAFMQDGLEPNGEDSDLVSLGSLYYEPLWVFYRGSTELSRFSQLVGKKLAIGEPGSGTAMLSQRLLSASGVDDKKVEFHYLHYAQAVAALQKGEVDAAFFIATPDDTLIKELLTKTDLRLMSFDQAEAIARQMPFLHHLVLPHGTIDLQRNIPEQDVHLVSSTATLVARASLHPALIGLLLKAATEVHSEPGIFEHKGEFPIDKDDDFPVSPEAKRYYRSGAPFWQHYLPFWLAILVERFLLVVLPLLALIVPLVRSVPKLLAWRIRSRIYKRYGLLKYLETQLKAETDDKLYAEHLRQLDQIDEGVNHMKVPLEFAEHLYVLRQHIDFVRGKLTRGLATPEPKA